MKVRPLDPGAVAAARVVLAASDVRHPRDIHVEAMAAKRGALILYGKVATSRASIVRGGTLAVIRIDARAEGTPWSRFTGAHELGHHEQHRVVDHYEQCAGEGKRGAAYKIERQADDFAAELLIPELLGAPYCAKARPSLDDVTRVACAFRTSIEMSAIRVVQLATSACAAALVVDGAIGWAPESAPFPGKIVKGRRVDARSAVAQAPRRAGEWEREVPATAWGGPEGAVFLEQGMRLGDRVLCWVAPA